MPNRVYIPSAGHYGEVVGRSTHGFGGVSYLLVRLDHGETVKVLECDAVPVIGLAAATLPSNVVPFPPDRVHRHTIRMPDGDGPSAA